ncbi:mannosyl-3-phosphoglycerate phosphatase [Acaryochloris sp. CCMEE 5410]|uniref:HAD-IIB family hydrolase n=1 Tax=Acaryochloris sp. CCMEE 5410 TaxID=310037 RepID=UPI0002484407|nr:HAD-IIB family hydrolase [Acaryochloris sp. CCMEE 5410]KAI9135269.1 HAD-IIB family hydrolase [Acaryochloris sp. CCMEE 5410]
MTNAASYLVFTDLDGTLLNHDDYRYDDALPMLAWLKDHQIPVIAVTSKTRVEVEELLQALSFEEPFVVENGSGVFIPYNDQRFDLSHTDVAQQEQHQRLCLGCTYDQARTGLKTLSQRLNQPLQGFGDMTVDELIALTGLSSDDALKAQTREFTEPFVNPGLDAKELEQHVAAIGFQVLVGDRFCHLIGVGAGKGKAVNLLVQCYQVPQGPVKTVGLGNSPNDLAMLEVVDIPIVIPGVKGPHPGLADRGWQIAPATGAKGWSMAMEQVRDQYWS